MRQAERGWSRPPPDIPSWFVIGDADLNIPPALQRFEAERAGARGTREVSGGSHALAVSNPDVIAQTILDALDAVTPTTAAVD
jgi:pimeloyl-ACP methyl ester carboxylesterase